MLRHRFRILVRLCAITVAAAAVIPAPPADARAQARRSIILATTTSTQDSRLLDVLVPRFEKETGIEVKVIAVGTGAALRMASRGDADAVLVHAPAAEQRLVEAGDLVGGRRIMHNDFVIVGPAQDPAGVRGQTSAAGAMRAIASRGTFVSRGDDSGTHTQELALWKAAGVDPRALGRLEQTGQGMGATLTIADQKDAYTLADRGTYLALRNQLSLAILFEGDPSLHNVYHAYAVNPARHRTVKHAEARSFVEFLVSPAAQRLIGEFRREELGQPLFVPDAMPTGREEVGRR